MSYNMHLRKGGEKLPGLTKEEKGIVKEKRNNVIYVFYVLETYRNKKGQPTNKGFLLVD